DARGSGCFAGRDRLVIQNSHLGVFQVVVQLMSAFLAHAGVDERAPVGPRRGQSGPRRDVPDRHVTGIEVLVPPAAWWRVDGPLGEVDASNAVGLSVGPRVPAQLRGPHEGESLALRNVDLDAALVPVGGRVRAHGIFGGKGEHAVTPESEVAARESLSSAGSCRRQIEADGFEVGNEVVLVHDLAIRKLRWPRSGAEVVRFRHVAVTKGESLAVDEL